MRAFVFATLAATTLLLSACDGTGESGPDEQRYFQFVYTSSSETFVAATADPEVIDQVEAQLEKPKDERDLIIVGPIARGEVSYNPGYPWHFVEGEWKLAEAATEVCDARPSRLGEDLNYWVDEVGRYCPFASRVQREVEPVQ